MKWQAERYNGIDSTSMPVEKAQSLLASLLYTLSVAAEEDCISTEALFHMELQPVINRGREILKIREHLAEVKWNEMCIKAPDIRNYYFMDTLKNLGTFFKLYDIDYASHEIPCSIDYPLMNHVSEELKGLSYVEEYINRISIENDFINCFSKETVICLYERSISEYKENYFNLCEPVFINAVGKRVLDEDIGNLSISSDKRKLLTERLKYNTRDEIIRIVIMASHAVVLEHECHDEHYVKYFAAAAEELGGRIADVIQFEDLSNIFVTVE